MFAVEVKSPPAVSRLLWQRLHGVEPIASEGRTELHNPALAAALVRSASRQFTEEEWAAFLVPELSERHWIRGKGGNLFEPSVTQPVAPRMRLEPLADGRVGCSFVPRVPGPHVIAILCGKTHIEGSEFVCDVRERGVEEV